MSDHDWEYEEELLQKLEFEDMKKHCPGCPYWNNYYLCTQGGHDNCIYNINLNNTRLCMNNEPWSELV